MLSLSKYLEEKESTVWNIPSILERDESITSYKELTIYDDTHGTGDLSTVREFSFTTNNEDIFLVPSNSYLLARVRLNRDNGDPIKQNEGCTIDINAFNLFKEGRLYIEDNEIERVEEIGITTLIYNLTQYTTTEVNSIRESQLVHTNPNFIRKYILECEVKNPEGNANVYHEIELLLPIKKIFPFWHHVTHVFRGVKHRITLTLNDVNKIVYKFATTGVNPANGVFALTSLEWKIPHIEPSLPMQSKIETMLAKNSTMKISYPAVSVYKMQPPQISQIRLPLSSTVHKPTHVLIAFQKATRLTDQAHSFMNFDNMDVEYCNIEINGIKYPDKDVICEFNKPYRVQEMFKKLLEFCQEGVSFEESYRNFIKQFPLFHIDVSRHKPELYANTNFPNLVINTKFRSIPTEPYYVYIILYNIRELTLNLENKKMRIIK